MIRLLAIAALLLVSATTPPRAVWSKQKANAWYLTKGWLRGSDFIPSTAINQLEMWQEPTFDAPTIDRELGYAQGIGLNCMRVFLHHVAWQEDPKGFKTRMDKYLEIAGKHHIQTIFVFFDDCWNPTYHAGTQPKPKPGIHNSGWLRDPGKLYYDEPKLADTLVRRLEAAAAAGEIRNDLSADTLARWIVRINFSLIAEPARSEDGGDEGLLRSLLVASLNPCAQCGHAARDRC